MPFICLSNFVKLDVKCLFPSNTAVGHPLYSCTINVYSGTFFAFFTGALVLDFILYGKIELIIYTQQE